MLGYNDTVATINLDTDGKETFRGNVKILASCVGYGIGVELPDGNMEIPDLPAANSIEDAKDIIGSYWGHSPCWDLQWV